MPRVTSVDLSESPHKGLTGCRIVRFAAACALMLILLLVFSGCSAVAGSGVANSSSSNPSSLEASFDTEGMTEATVVRVVDGDTLQVKIDGRREKVRLIGINCPESVAQEQWRNTEEGKDASNFTDSVLSEGDTVWLQADYNDVDQYDRLLRYVWIEKPTDRFDEDEVATKMLNGILVSEGFAEARVYGKDDLYADTLEELERQAVRADRGVSYMWA